MQRGAYDAPCGRTLTSKGRPWANIIFVQYLYFEIMYFSLPFPYVIFSLFVLLCYSFPILLSAQMDFLYLSLYLY